LLEKGVMDEESLGGLMAQITSGLEYLHGKDILHQDIKPDNIETCDIFSLGVLVYELATGNVPWMGNGGISLDSGADLPELPGHYSFRFRKLVELMMNSDPASRPKSGELADITQKYVDTNRWPVIKAEPAQAKSSGGRKTQKFDAQAQKPPSGTLDKTKKDGKPHLSVPPKKKKSASNGILFAAALVLIMTVAGGFFYITVQNAQAEQITQRQENEEALAVLVQQSDEAKVNEYNTVDVGFYQEAPEVHREDEDVNQLLGGTRVEIEGDEAQSIAEEQEAARQRELAAEREREEQRQREIQERRSRPDITADPIQGTIALESGFTPDPWPQVIQMQPEINLEDAGYYGFATSAPLINLSYEADDMPLILKTESSSDLVMLVYAPDGEWYFNDDFSDLNPGFQFDYPESGTYMIWVGGYEEISESAILSISEVVDSSDEEEIISEAGGEGPDVGATPNYGNIELSAGFSPDPYTESATAGGSYDTSEMGYGGYVSTAPDFDLYYTPGTYSLTIKAESSEDIILLINTPGGEWLFNDDFDGLNPGITIDTPEEGLYNIWIGSYNSEPVDATLIITEL